MRESDAAAIGELMGRFLPAVSFEQSGRPSYGELPELFVSDARLIRNSGASPEISTVEEFVRARQDAVDAGELISFEEFELSETTELFGNVGRSKCVARSRRSSFGRPTVGESARWPGTTSGPVSSFPSRSQT